MNTRTLNEGISFSKEPKSLAGGPILKIMSNFVDAFAQAKPPIRVGVRRLRERSKGFGVPFTTVIACKRAGDVSEF